VIKILEKQVESFLVREVKKLGGLAYKFSSPGKRSVPDRLCLFPTGLVAFVELKRPGKKATMAQAREIEKIKKRGVIALVIDSKPRVKAFINWIEKKIEARKLVLR